MKNIGTTLAAITIASALQLAAAGDRSDPKPLRKLTDKEAKELCANTNQRSGILLDGVDLCKTFGNNKSTATPPVVASSKPIEVVVKEDTGNSEFCSDGSPRDKNLQCTSVNDGKEANETADSENSNNTWRNVGLGALGVVGAGGLWYRRKKAKKTVDGIEILKDLNQKSWIQSSIDTVKNKLSGWKSKFQKQKNAGAISEKIVSVRGSLEKGLPKYTFIWEESGCNLVTHIPFPGKFLSITIDTDGHIYVRDELAKEDSKYMQSSGKWGKEPQIVSIEKLVGELEHLFSLPQTPVDVPTDTSETLVSEERVVSPVVTAPVESAEDSSEFHGNNFDGIVGGSGLLAVASSPGGSKFMEDYINANRETDGRVTMIALDGVSQCAKPDTTEFVEYVGKVLEKCSLSDMFNGDISYDKTKFEGKNVRATVGRVVIDGDIITLEKVGDIGMLIFDKDGNLVYQDLSGGFIPADWFGSTKPLYADEDKEDYVSPESIVQKIHAHGFKNPPSYVKGIMKTRGEFMKHYGTYTLQIRSDLSRKNLTKRENSLTEGDVVVLATDGVWDNISVARIIQVIRSHTTMREGSAAILSELDTLCSSGTNDLGLNYKVDNIGLTIYQHTKKDAAIETVPETPNMKVSHVDTDITPVTPISLDGQKPSETPDDSEISDVASRPSGSVPAPKPTEEETLEVVLDIFPENEMSSDDHDISASKIDYDTILAALEVDIEALWRREKVPSSLPDSDVASSDTTDAVDNTPEAVPVGEASTSEMQEEAPVVENQLSPTEVTSGVPVALEGEIPTDEAQGIVPVVDSPEVPTEETLVIPVSETVADVPSDSAQNNEISLQGSSSFAMPNYKFKSYSDMNQYKISGISGINYGMTNYVSGNTSKKFKIKAPLDIRIKTLLETSKVLDLTLKNHINNTLIKKSTPKRPKMLSAKDVSIQESIQEQNVFVQKNKEHTPNVGEVGNSVVDQYKKRKIIWYNAQIDEAFTPTATEIRGRGVTIELGKDFIVEYRGPLNFVLTNKKTNEVFEKLTGREKVKEKIITLL